MVLVVFDLVVFDVDSVFVDIDVVVNCMLVCQKRLILILSYLILSRGRLPPDCPHG